MTIPFDARPLYRVRKDIAYGKVIVRRGSLHRLNKVPADGLKKLKERGTISEVMPPPLAVLPGWTRRATRLEEAGIANAVQFLGADVDRAAAFMRVKPSTVEKWRREVLCMLGAPGENGRRR